MDIDEMTSADSKADSKMDPQTTQEAIDDLGEALVNFLTVVFLPWVDAMDRSIRAALKAVGYEEEV